MARIIIDHRETRNPIVPELEKLGASIELKQLEIGDYIVSDYCGFEYKATADFIESMIGNEKLKVLRQCRELALNYSKPCLLIGCDLSDLFVQRNIHYNSIWGCLQSIIWAGCPIRFLPTPEIAANYIFETAKKEQEGVTKAFSEHGNKTKKTPDEQREYIVSAIPTVGPVTAIKLLQRFGSIEMITIATRSELEEVEGIGTETSKLIKKILSEEYERTTN